MNGGEGRRSPSRTSGPSGGTALALAGPAECVQAGEVGEEAGRDGLEELQRRPGDHQHVEDEARPRPRPSWRLTSSGPALRKACSLNMISSTAAAKPLPWASEKSARPRPRRRPGPRAGGALGAHCAAAGEGQRHHEQAERLGRRRSRARPRTGPRAARSRPRPRTRCARSTRRGSAPRRGGSWRCAGEEAAGEVARRVGEDGGEEDPVEGLVAGEQVVLDRPAQDQRDGPRRRAPARPGSIAATRTGSAIVLALRLPLGDRGARAAGRPAGRGSRR